MSLQTRIKAAGAAAGTAPVDAGRRRAVKRRTKRAVMDRMGYDEVARISAYIDPALARSELRPAVEAALNVEEPTDLATSERETIIDEILDDVVGLGPLQPLIEDDTVTEIMINGCRSAFFERGGVLYPIEHVFEDDEQIRVLVDRIISPLGRRIDERSPIVNARLKTGYRVNAVIPPVAIDGPILTIRKFSDRICSLDELVGLGSLPLWYAQLLSCAVSLRQDLAVAGGTGSGKTTLLNALSCEISTGERIVTIEDSAELKFAHHPHVVRLEAREASIEGEGAVTIRDLVTNALRMRPDRIVVGEVRGAECCDMLQAIEHGPRRVAHHTSCGFRTGDRGASDVACTLWHRSAERAHRGADCHGARRHRDVRAPRRWQAFRLLVFGGASRRVGRRRARALCDVRCRRAHLDA